MDNNQLVIPQYALDQLADQVCMRLDYFARIYNPTTVWEGVLLACGQIEQNPEAVSSVIVLAKQKYSGIAISGSSIRYYHLFLTRIYVLLYYRHHDDDVFNVAVFPQLSDNMGIYRDKDILPVKIQEPIQKILERKALLEKSRKQQKFGQPKFRLYSLSDAERDGYMEEFNEEALFRVMRALLCSRWRQYHFSASFVDIWYNAKDVVRKLWDTKYPQTYIDYVIERYDKELGHVSGPLPQAILTCVYCMMCTVTKSDHFSKAIHTIEDSVTRHGRYYILADSVTFIKSTLAKFAEEFKDYDYVGAVHDDETYTKADVEKLVSSYSSKLEEANRELLTKTEEINALNAQLSNMAKEEDGDDTSDGTRFSCGEYACLLYAAAQELEEKTVKSKLKVLFAKITGYSVSRFDKKLMGAFSEDDKASVIAKIKGDMPNWAEKVGKL